MIAKPEKSGWDLVLGAAVWLQPVFLVSTLDLLSPNFHLMLLLIPFSLLGMFFYFPFKLSSDVTFPREFPLTDIGESEIFVC